MFNYKKKCQELQVINRIKTEEIKDNINGVNIGGRLDNIKFRLRISAITKREKVEFLSIGSYIFACMSNPGGNNVRI